PLTASEFVAKAKPLKQGAGEYVQAKKAVVFAELPTNKNQVLFANFDMKQAEVFWYRSSGVYNSALTPTVSLFNNYFGGGMGSIVFQTIRESKALAYSTYAITDSLIKRKITILLEPMLGRRPINLTMRLKA